MILLDLGGEDHELYLKSEIDEIKNENLRRLYQEKFVIVENICQVLKKDLPRLALTSQISYGEVGGQTLRYEDYEERID